MAAKSSIVSGMGLAMSIITNLMEEVRAAGGTDEDIHRLATPEGRPLLREMAKLAVSKEEAVEVNEQEFPLIAIRVEREEKKRGGSIYTTYFGPDGQGVPGFYVNPCDIHWYVDETLPEVRCKVITTSSETDAISQVHISGPAARLRSFQTQLGYDVVPQLRF